MKHIQRSNKNFNVRNKWEPETMEERETPWEQESVD